MADFIEFIERAIDPNDPGRYDGGTVMVSWINADLPSGYHYRIIVRENGGCECDSRAFGNGSVRHYSFRTYEEAQEHALAWCKRKLAEERRYRKRLARQLEVA